MIALTPEASGQVWALRDHCAERDHPEVVRDLRTSFAAAWDRIIANPAGGLSAPRPYPHLAMAGCAWIISGRYWIAHRTAPPVIVADFYETANITGRL